MVPSKALGTCASIMPLLDHMIYMYYMQTNKSSTQSCVTCMCLQLAQTLGTCMSNFQFSSHACIHKFNCITCKQTAKYVILYDFFTSALLFAYTYAQHNNYFRSILIMCLKPVHLDTNSTGKTLKGD